MAYYLTKCNHWHSKFFKVNLIPCKAGGIPSKYKRWACLWQIKTATILQRYDYSTSSKADFPEVDMNLCTQ